MFLTVHKLNGTRNFQSVIYEHEHAVNLDI